MQKELDQLVQNSAEAVEDEMEFQFTEEEMEYQQRVIKQIAGRLIKQEIRKTEHRKIKAKRRAKNKVARQSRKANRK